MKKSTVYLLAAMPVNRKVFAKVLTSSPGKQKIVSETTYDPTSAQHFDSEVEAKETLSQIKSIHSFSVFPFQMEKPQPIGKSTPLSRRTSLR